MNEPKFIVVRFLFYKIITVLTFNVRIFKYLNINGNHYINGTIYEYYKLTIVSFKRLFKQNLIDWNQAILGQVGSLGQHYSEWVNLPVTRDIKLFKSNILESLTITPWYMIPIIWIPVCLHFLYCGWTHISIDNTGNYILDILTCSPSFFFSFSFLSFIVLYYAYIQNYVD